MIKKFLAFVFILSLALPNSALSNDDLDIWTIDGYYDNGDDSYLYVNLENHTELLFTVNFTSKGQKIEMLGIFDDDDNTIYAVDDKEELEAELKFINEDTVKVNVNSDFAQLYKGEANGTYKKHYGK